MNVAQAGLFDDAVPTLASVSTPVPLAASGVVADNRLRESLAEVFGRIPTAWRAVTDPFIHSAQGQALAAFVDRSVREGALVYPGTVFRALDFNPPEAVRVVILGQDPYHGPGQAQGLAFSVASGQRKLPPSLRNILKEVAADIGAPSACLGDLSPWARQGVLLLNSALTVEDGAPQSHAGRGWEALTDALLACVAAQTAPVVFILWGASAQRKQPLIERTGLPLHRVLMANHPSPLSASRPPVPFVGCRHFSLANSFLAAQGSGAVAISW